MLRLVQFVQWQLSLAEGCEELDMCPRSRQLRSCGQGSGRRRLPALVAARSPFQTRQQTLGSASASASASASVCAGDAEEAPGRAREREQKRLVYGSAVALQALISPGSRGNQFLLQEAT
eukprot:COSAG02_NODE_28966_length_578_cov_1.494781_1_plen_119_part_10